jgi:hypothetical protein
MSKSERSIQQAIFPVEVVISLAVRRLPVINLLLFDKSLL